MIKILFVCHGNICRSPMAEYLMKFLIGQRGVRDDFLISSAATSREELGKSIYPPVKEQLRRHGIPFAEHHARQMTAADYEEYDYLIGMDHENLWNMLRICNGDPKGKISLLLDETDRPRDVSDPWYSGDFDRAWRDISEGCQALSERLTAR